MLTQHAQTGSAHVYASQLIGKEIITANGEKVSKVKDVLYDAQQNKVLALVIDDKALFAKTKVLQLADVLSFGEDAIIIKAEDLIKPLDEAPELVSQIAHQDTYLDRTAVITQDGQKLGRVTDIIFDTTTGLVQELEISGTMMDTVASGRKSIPVSNILSVGKDATMVSAATSTLVEQQAQTQGLKGGLHETRARAQQQVQAMREGTPNLVQKAQTRTQEIGQNVQGRFEELQNKPETRDAVERVKSGVSQAKENVQNLFESGMAKVADQQRERALGQYLTINVLAPDDTLLASRGDLVTNKLLAQAEEMGMLSKVVNNVSKEPVTATQSAASTETDENSEVL